MKYNFEKMDWWKSKKIMPGLCGDVKEWVNKCEGPDDFYDNAPLDYLIGSIAIRDPKTGLQLIYDIFNVISAENDLDELIDNSIDILTDPESTKNECVIEYYRLTTLITQGQHTPIEKALYKTFAWQLDYKDETVVSIITHHLQKFIPSMDSVVRSKVSKGKWLKSIDDTNKSMGLGKVNDD